MMVHPLTLISGFDATEELVHEGWQFLCSGERLPDGTFHSVLRCRVAPGGGLRTLRFGQDRLSSASEALSQAREMAAQWALDHVGCPVGTGRDG